MHGIYELGDNKPLIYIGIFNFAGGGTILSAGEPTIQMAKKLTYGLPDHQSQQVGYLGVGFAGSIADLLDFHFRQGAEC